MKNKFLVILLLVFSQSFSQTVSEINKTLNIPDSLTHKKEIRVYKWYQTTNVSELFRMYFDGKKWEYIFYKHYNKLSDNNQSTFEKIILTPQNEDLVWLKIGITDIDHLPNLEEIRYKLKKAEIVFYDDQYVVSENKMYTTDGVGYQALYKEENVFNNITFNNYQSYLDTYPNVDELIAYAKLISVISEEFGIWK